MPLEAKPTFLPVILLLALVQCHNTASDSARDAGATDAQGDDARRSTAELDVSGDATGHIALSGGTQLGKLEPGFIPFTFSQTNDAPLDGSTRVTFSLQSKDPPAVGQAMRGQGHLVYNGETYHTTLCDIVIKSETPPSGAARERWLEGEFSCHDLHGPGHKTADISGDHFFGKFTDSTTL